MTFATTLLKYLAYGFLISIYAVFAWYGKTSVEGFILVLVGFATSLGTTHIAERAAAPSQPSTTVATETKDA